VHASAASLGAADLPADAREATVTHHNHSWPIPELEAANLLHPRCDRPGDRL